MNVTERDEGVLVARQDHHSVTVGGFGRALDNDPVFGASVG